MKKKKRNSKPTIYVLKHLIIFYLSFLCFSSSSQNNNVTDFNLQVLNSVWIKDTSKADKTWRYLSFTISLQEASRLKSFNVEITDKKGTVISELDFYELKTHPNGFYYVENKSNDKKTVTNNNVSFIHKMDVRRFSQAKKIRVNYYVSGNNDKKSLAVPIENE